MMIKSIFTSILILFLFIFNQHECFSQQTANWLERDDPMHYRKLYLHTDREFYFVGDTIWFKAYYLDGQTHRYISGFYNMYVDLLDKDGQSIYSQVLPIDEGIVSGNIKIPKLIEKGNYVLRAFTEFQKSIGEEAFFHKTLEIAKIESSLVISNNKSTMNQNEKIDIAFLPEGGFLLEGEINIVGFKALNEKGQGISVQGEIIDDKGEFVSSFNTSYKGMGKIFLKPFPGEVYKVKIENYPDYTYEFGDIKKDGIKIVYKGNNDESLFFHVITNSNLFQGKEYYFAILNRGRVLYYEKFVLQYSIFQIDINQSGLPPGINKFVLLDNKLNPISERLYFSKNFDINDIKINLNQDQFKTRSNVQIELFDEKDIEEGVYSSLSITVVDNNAMVENEPSSNILSYLLIDSELKGNIESPSDFFISEDRISSELKLSLLMLTQGWSKYIWNVIPEKEIEFNSNKFEGITIRGEAKRLFNKRPLIDGEIVLRLFKDDSQDVFVSKTDTNGRFSFDSIVFTDTAEVFIQALNKRGKSLTELFLDTIFEQNPNISDLYLPVEKVLDEDIANIYRQKYNSGLDMRAFSPEFDVHEIEEVVIKAQKIERADDHNRFYRKARTSLKIREHDYVHSNMLDYLNSRRVPGVQQSIQGDYIVIRGLSSLLYNGPPLVLVDNVEVPYSELEYIPMANIDKVEILKTPHELAALGMRGTFGAISILTKQGEGYTKINSPIKGAISKKIIGYSSYREFYSPKYLPENINSKKPDHRLTLYWNPNLITENGKASISFFTSDDLSKFRVFVEGVTTKGKICIGTSEFRVE